MLKGPPVVVNPALRWGKPSGGVRAFSTKSTNRKRAGVHPFTSLNSYTYTNTTTTLTQTRPLAAANRDQWSFLNDNLTCRVLERALVRACRVVIPRHPRSHGKVLHLFVRPLERVGYRPLVGVGSILFLSWWKQRIQTSSWSFRVATQSEPSGPNDIRPPL